MSSKKNEQSLNEKISAYTNYFKEDLDAIEEELNKSKEYSEIIDSEIGKLKDASFGTNKGVQHYLIEHIANAVQLQTQRQGLRKDRFAIKKAIIDYASKFAEDESTGSSTDLEAAISRLLAKEEPQTQNEIIDDADLDNAIDSKLKK